MHNGWLEGSEISGMKINSAYFTTSESVDKILDFEFVRTNVQLHFRDEKSGEYKLEMSYYDNDCQIGASNVE